MSGTNTITMATVREHVLVKEIAEALTRVKDTRDDLTALAELFEGRRKNELMSVRTVGELLRSQEAKLDYVLMLVRPWMGGG